MRISYDAQVDAVSISFRDTTVTTEDLAEGIAAEYDADGKLVGLEILDAATRFGDLSTLRQAPRFVRRREPVVSPDAKGAMKVAGSRRVAALARKGTRGYGSPKWCPGRRLNRPTRGQAANSSGRLILRLR
jgi:uncharacterized protein YuzE